MSARDWVVTGTSARTFHGATSRSTMPRCSRRGSLTARSGTFEATRFALGRKNALRIEINGTDGSLAFDFEENNVLQFFDGTEPVEEQGFRRILVTEPEHPYLSAWWPPGHGLGYEHGFTHQVVDLVDAIAENRQPTPSFDDGLSVQRVLGAVENSAARDSAWTTV